MKIVADCNIPFLEGRIADARLVSLPARQIDRDAVRDADALVVRTRTRCDAALLQGSGVRVVATATIGTDHIDLNWCAANGITVRNAPGCNAPGVALYVWSSLLRSGFDPARHALGLVGCGNVGSIVAKWGKMLGARLLVCDPPRKDAGFSDYDYVSLPYLLSHADAVTLHTPLSLEGKYKTFHLIGAEALAVLKRGAIFVNAARGEVVDTPCVVEAIRSNVIKTAVIDTWEGEPTVNRDLLQLADVATCHIAGYSVEGKQRATRMALEALRQSLGLKVDLDSLAPAYRPPLDLTPQRIVSAFDPSLLTESLKRSPGDFELLRNNYPLHRELS